MGSNDLDERRSRVFYGALLLSTFTLAHAAGAFYSGLYLLILGLLMLAELGCVVSEEASKYLNSCLQHNSKVREDGDVNRSKGDVCDGGDAFDETNVAQVASGLKRQFWFLEVLGLFWYYARALSQYSDHPLQSHRDLAALGLPQITISMNIYLLEVCEMLIRNYSLVTVVLYCCYVLRLIVFCTLLNNRQILLAEITSAAAHHLVLFLVMFPCNLCVIISLDFGVFWCFISLFCVISNDISAYIIGKTMGTRALTFLSPKKTVEGFIGAIFVTITLAICITYLAINYVPHTLELPLFFQGIKFQNKASYCDKIEDVSKAFENGHNKYSSSYNPTQSFQSSCFAFVKDSLGLRCEYVHVMVIATFASLFAPFGGLLSSAVKRSLNRKDFSNALGAHGGFSDRFDCKGAQAMFAYAYLSMILQEHLMRDNSVQ